MFQWNIQTVMESLEVGTAVKINSSQRISLIQGGKKRQKFPQTVNHKMSCKFFTAAARQKFSVFYSEKKRGNLMNRIVHKTERKMASEPVKSIWSSKNEHS